MTDEIKHNDNESKLIIIGDKRVGKSSLRNHLLGRPMKSGQYSQKSVADFMKMEMAGKTIKIFDIQDIEQLRNNTNLQQDYLRKLNGLLLMFAINDKTSYEAIPELLSMVIKHNKKKLIPIAIVGNKNDLRIKGEEFITYREAAEYTKRISKWANIEIPYYDISVKFDTGIKSIKEFVAKREIIPLNV